MDSTTQESTGGIRMSYVDYFIYAYSTLANVCIYHDMLLTFSMHVTSLVPRRSGGGAKEKNAWYTLFAHAFIFRRISENRIFP